MDTSRNTIRKLICATAFSVALTGTAAAQFPAPSINLEQEKQRTPDQIEKDRQVDKAYQSATKKIPDQSLSTDPWSGVRPAPPTAPTKKKQQVSQDKKQQLSQGNKKPGE
jgi:hypothetical protein